MMIFWHQMFPSPCGENPLSHGLRRASSPERGSLVQGKWQLQKLSLRESRRAAPERVFTGISWNTRRLFFTLAYSSFRPLAGISWNRLVSAIRLLNYLFPSPCGDKLKSGCCWCSGYRKGFRPLAGISWNIRTNSKFLYLLKSFRPLAGISWNNTPKFHRKQRKTFPSPCGDKLK